MNFNGEDLEYYYESSGVRLQYPNFVFKTGDIVVLNQKSGKGKSTFINLLLGLLKPSRGNVYVVNESKIKSLDSISNTIISYIPQDGFLLNDTILNNITLTSKKFEDDIDMEKLKNAYTLAGASGLFDHNGKY